MKIKKIKNVKIRLLAAEASVGRRDSLNDLSG